MSVNKLLPYLSAVHYALEQATNQLDQDLADADDGEAHDAEEAKDIVRERIRQVISELEKLKVDVDRLNYKKFCNEYEVSAS